MLPLRWTLLSTLTLAAASAPNGTQALVAPLEDPAGGVPMRPNVIVIRADYVG